jgi:hypothetical protein
MLVVAVTPAPAPVSLVAAAMFAAPGAPMLGRTGLTRPVRAASVAGGSASAAARAASRATATAARAAACGAAAAAARAAADRPSAAAARAAAAVRPVATRTAGAGAGRGQRKRRGRRNRRCDRRRSGVTLPGHGAGNLMGGLERHALHHAGDLAGELGQRILAQLGQAHGCDRRVRGQDRDHQDREGAYASRSSHRGRSLFAQIQCSHFPLALEFVIPGSCDDRPTHPPDAGWLSAGRHAHA